MGGISLILVKNHFFILLNQFDLHTIIYDSLMFQTSITVRSHSSGHMKISVPFKYLIRGVFHRIFLNCHFLNVLTNSKCKGFCNFQAIKLRFFLYVPQSMLKKQSIQFFYISPTFWIKNKVHIAETRKFRKLSFDKKKSFSSGSISEIWIIGILLDVSKILWKKFYIMYLKFVRGDRF